MVKVWLKRISLIFLLSVFCSGAFASLSGSINRLLEEQNPHEKIGVYIQNLKTGEVLYSYKATRALTPASTTKAFTAAAAYIALGPSYRYVTTISTNGRIDEPLRGNLYIHFSGDPTLSSVDIDRLIQDVRRRGIVYVKGDVILDETVFSGPEYGRGWGSEDILRCYGAPITGAIINSDCSSRYGVIRNPNDYAERVVRYALINAGIHVDGRIIEGKTPPHTTVLAAHYSSSLQNILDYMLKFSDDVYANAIFKTMGHHYYRVGSYREGARAVHHILSQHFSSLFERLRLHDGSGLSTENLISPHELVALYRYMYHDKRLREDFIHSLAISDRSGTLVHRLTSPLLRGHVYAKTGTFASDRGGVSNLAGYLILPGHDPIAFAVMVNNTDEHDFKAETLQDDIVRTVAEYQVSMKSDTRHDEAIRREEASRHHESREEELRHERERHEEYVKREEAKRHHEEELRHEHKRHEEYLKREEAKHHHEEELRHERERHEEYMKREEAKRHHEEELRHERERHEEYVKREEAKRHHEEELRHKRERHEEYVKREEAKRHHEEELKREEEAKNHQASEQ